MTRDEILAGSPDAPWTDIEIPEWGGTYLLKPISGALAEEVALLNVQAKETGHLLCLQGLAARVTVNTVCDRDRRLVFKPTDSASLTDKHLEVCSRVYGAVLRSNKLAEDEEAIEEAGKNSESIQT